MAKEEAETKETTEDLLARAVSMLEGLTRDVDELRSQVKSNTQELTVHRSMMSGREEIEAGFEPVGREAYEKHPIFGPALEGGEIQWHRMVPKMDYDNLVVNGLAINLRQGVPMETVTPFYKEAMGRELI